MKILLVGFTGALLGALLGFLLNSPLVFNGVFWPSGQSKSSSAQNQDLSGLTTPTDLALTSSSSDSSPASKSITTIEESPLKPARQTNGTQQSSISSFDDIKRFNTHASIADQQAILALVVDADLDQIKNAIADIPTESNRIYQHQWAVELLLKRMIELDPHAAYEQVVQAISDGSGPSGSDMTSYLLLQNYARMQSDSLFDWLDNLPSDSLSLEHLMGVYGVLAETDPERTIEGILKNEALLSNRFDGLEMVLYSWSSKDPQAALQWLDRHGDQELLTRHGPNIISQMAAYDLEEARTVAQNYPDLLSEDLFLYQEIETLAATDPLAALEMARSISSEGESVGAMHSVFYAWSVQDPVGAFEYIDTLPDPEEKRMFAQMMSSNIGSIGAHSSAKRQELLDWSVTLSEELKAAVQEPLISEWMSDEPAAAIEWLRYQGDLSEQTTLLRSLAWSLPSHDVQLSMDLYATSDTQTQMALSQGIVVELYQQDPTWAWSWYEGLPDNDAKSNALQGLIMITARDNPQMALDMASENLLGGQDFMLENVVMMVASEHPDVVDSWLATSPLDESVKAQLSTGITQMRSDMNRYGMSGASGFRSSMDAVDFYDRQYQFINR